MVAVGFGSVNDLTLVKLIGQMGKDGSGQFDTHTDVHTVGFGGNLQILTDRFHPLTADSSGRNDAAFTLVHRILANDLIAAVFLRHGKYSCIKEEIDLLLQISIQIFQNDIINIRSQMANRCIQQMQIILNAERFEASTGGGIKLRSLAAILQVDFVNIVHQFQRPGLTDVLIQCTAKVVGDIIFAIGKCAGATKAAHNAAALTSDTGLDFVTVNGTLTLVQRMARLKHSDLQFGIVLSQFVGCKNSSRTCANNNHIIFHGLIHLPHGIFAVTK